MEGMDRERLGVEPVVVPGGRNCYFADAAKVAELISEAVRHM